MIFHLNLQLYTKMYKSLSFNFTNENAAKIATFKQLKASKPIYSEFTIFRTYSRYIEEEDRKETPDEIFMRVVRGVFSIIKDHLTTHASGNLWEQHKGDLENKAMRMLKLMYEDKMTPPGRGLWAMGTKLVNVNKMAMALVNCTFITSENIAIVLAEFFAYVMDCLMLGVGVGFNDLGAGRVIIYMPNFAPTNVANNRLKSRSDQYGGFIHTQILNFINQSRANNFTDESNIMYLQRELDYIYSVSAQLTDYRKSVSIHVIKDSRDGWVNALRVLLNSYFIKGSYIVIFDYSKIRNAGIPLKTFGGVASGPIPLAELLSATRYLLQNRYIGKTIDSLFIIDVCNLIARTVIAGNVRRSSQICLSTNKDIVNAKLYSMAEYKYRAKWGWASNNSYIVTSDTDTDSNVAQTLDSQHEQISMETIATILKNNFVNGEPGLFMLDNARKYGRLIDGPNYADLAVTGTNPCGEISLQGSVGDVSNVPFSCGGETCNLVETFPCNYADVNDYYEDLELAVLYAKAVTLIPYHWAGTNKIQEANRRIGVSMSGIALLLAKMGYDLDLFAEFCDKAYKHVCDYDRQISELFGIPESIKKTTVKPSGTVSICANVTSGMHFPIYKTYLRRIRFSETDHSCKELLERSGVPIEKDKYSTNTLVAAFPFKIPYECITRDEITVEFQFKLLAVLQTYWADNQVSCTITFKDEEYPKLASLIYEYQHKIKGLSLLRLTHGSYEQAPLEAISQSQYEELSRNIKPLELNNIRGEDDLETDMYCDGDSCVFVPKSK
jgi:ribonucleoside-triphosphate reductase